MPLIDERPPLRSSKDGLDGPLDRQGELVTEPRPGFVIFIGSLVELRLGSAEETQPPLSWGVGHGVEPAARARRTTR